MCLSDAGPVVALDGHDASAIGQAIERYLEEKEGVQADLLMEVPAPATAAGSTLIDSYATRTSVPRSATTAIAAADCSARSFRVLKMMDSISGASPGSTSLRPQANRVSRLSESKPDASQRDDPSLESIRALRKGEAALPMRMCPRRDSTRTSKELLMSAVSQATQTRRATSSLSTGTARAYAQMPGGSYTSISDPGSDAELGNTAPPTLSS